MNKPIYMSRQELEMFYRLRQGDRVHEKAPLGNNLRPLQPLNSRSLRTNIALPISKVTNTTSGCASLSSFVANVDSKKTPCI